MVILAAHYDVDPGVSVMLNIGTLVYDPADRCTIGTVVKHCSVFPAWLWVAWPGCTELVKRDTLRVA